MKTVTLKQFMAFNPCYSREKLEAIRGDKEHWSALDILALDDVPKEDRMWAMLREELIDEMMLHEFGCRCAKRALSFVKNPDPRSVRAIEVKRAWMRGDATDAELAAAWHAARATAVAAAEHAAGDAGRDAGRAAAGAAWAAAEAAAWDAARAAARDAAGAAAGTAAWAAAGAAREAAGTAAWAAAGHAALEAERQWQVDELKRMLK